MFARWKSFDRLKEEFAKEFKAVPVPVEMPEGPQEVPQAQQPETPWPTEKQPEVWVCSGSRWFNMGSTNLKFLDIIISDHFRSFQISDSLIDVKTSGLNMGHVWISTG